MPSNPDNHQEPPVAGNREPSMRKAVEQTAQPLGPDSPLIEHEEVRNGDRGAASGRNLEQSRAIGQDPPTEGSRQGREANKKTGYPGTPDIGTDAAQLEDAERFSREKA